MLPAVPRERVETLRKAFKETFDDPEFVQEAKATKLELNYVCADEINGLVNEILNISPKTKKGLEFLVRKEKAVSKRHTKSHLMDHGAPRPASFPKGALAVSILAHPARTLSPSSLWVSQVQRRSLRF